MDEMDNKGVVNPAMDSVENETVETSITYLEKSLDVLNLTGVVKEYLGPWWKGACCRKSRERVVLNDISLSLKAGQITAILGNSGKQ